MLASSEGAGGVRLLAGIAMTKSFGFYYSSQVMKYAGIIMLPNLNRVREEKRYHTMLCLVHPSFGGFFCYSKCFLKSSALSSEAILYSRNNLQLSIKLLKKKKFPNCFL